MNYFHSTLLSFRERALVSAANNSLEMVLGRSSLEFTMIVSGVLFLFSSSLLSVLLMALVDAIPLKY
jgi:hypothetical protein